VAAAMLAASFELLTTIGTDVLTSNNVTAKILAVLITMAGQLYIAILIGLILGRVHKRLV
jgi:uncharacterized membrane protein